MSLSISFSLSFSLPTQPHDVHIHRTEVNSVQSDQWYKHLLNVKHAEMNFRSIFQQIYECAVIIRCMQYSKCRFKCRSFAHGLNSLCISTAHFKMCIRDILNSVNWQMLWIATVAVAVAVDSRSLYGCHKLLHCNMKAYKLTIM